MTEKQRAWVDFYQQGHAPADAARLAGYQAGSDRGFQRIGNENLRKLAEYVQGHDRAPGQGRVADRNELNAFWTEIIRDKNEKTSDRLKASELRGKAARIFLDRVERSGESTVRIILEGDMKELAE